ncbi:hypothetical protein TWF173_008043 [Orbilia oligospora]|nr:hypothetical protein TWF173_008043 [Orbilia oligospora]
MDSLKATVFYAAIIPIYGRVEITPENLRNLLDSANVEVPKGGESERQEDKVGEKQEEAEEESDEDMVLDSFDQCDPCWPWRTSSLDLYNTS